MLQWGAGAPGTELGLANANAQKSDREPLRQPAQVSGTESEAETLMNWEALPIRLVKTISFALYTGQVVAPDPQEQLCGTLAASAQAHDLPVSFFSNLIWQESRFDLHSVSHAGAQGIAQFMPDTAAETGLDDPFDPEQALPASARLLRQFKEQFGNLGLAAAAYNAGPNRISKWLAKRASLPRETRNYVKIITGRTAEEWRKEAVEEASFKIPARLPCRDLPEFVSIERQTNSSEYRPSESDTASKHRHKRFGKAGKRRSKHHQRVAHKSKGPEPTRISLAAADR